MSYLGRRKKNPDNLDVRQSVEPTIQGESVMTEPTPDTRETSVNEDTAPAVQDTNETAAGVQDTPVADEPTTDAAPAVQDDAAAADEPKVADGAPVPAETDETALTSNTPDGFVTEDGVTYNPEYATPAEAFAQGDEDNRAVAEYPSEPNIRAAEPNIGGESFSYAFKAPKEDA